jgi:tRNA threonylcarbamoyladenosine modification (KEOPS) complex  Pcc1 subunit
MESTITIDDPSKHIVALFEAELKDSINDRASYVLSHNAKKTTITIQARDIVALRATLNAVTKQLTVYEQMKKIV